jgi:hypothetical protein
MTVLTLVFIERLDLAFVNRGEVSNCEASADAQLTSMGNAGHVDECCLDFVDFTPCASERIVQCGMSLNAGQ